MTSRTAALHWPWRRWRWPAAWAQIIAAAPENLPLHAFLFGEDQARYLLAADQDVAADILYEAGAIGIPAAMLGVTGGDALILPGRQAISVKQLKATHEAWLPNYMTGKS